MLALGRMLLVLEPCEERFEAWSLMSGLLARRSMGKGTAIFCESGRVGDGFLVGEYLGQIEVGMAEVDLLGSQASRADS
jgi:hypothetical protein